MIGERNQTKFVSNIQTAYSTKRLRIDLDVIIEAFLENRDRIMADYNQLDESEQNEQLKYFNNVTKDDELGTFIFDREKEDHEITEKLSYDLDEEDQRNFIDAVDETRFITIRSIAFGNWNESEFDKRVDKIRHEKQ